jgi:hypothetical protein
MYSLVDKGIRADANVLEQVKIRKGEFLLFCVAIWHRRDPSTQEQEYIKEAVVKPGLCARKEFIHCHPGLGACVLVLIVKISSS